MRRAPDHLSPLAQASTALGGRRTEKHRSSQERGPIRSRVFRTSYRRCFHAVVETFAQSGHIIKRGSLEDGRIETDLKRLPGDRPWLTKFSATILRVDERHTRVTLSPILFSPRLGREGRWIWNPATRPGGGTENWTFKTRTVLRGWRRINLSEDQEAKVCAKYFKMIRRELSRAGRVMYADNMDGINKTPTISASTCSPHWENFC